MKEFTVPEGEYFIGDPVYIIPKRFFTMVRTKTENYNKEFYHKGKFVGGFYTSFGEGEYSDNFENYYAIDSGIIAICDRKWYEGEFKIPFGSNEFYIDEPIECFTNDTKLIFGDVIIDTNYGESYEDEFYGTSA